MPATELFYGDIGSAAADYRAVGLSDLRRSIAGTSAGVGGVDTGCASCLSCDPGSVGKQHAVVCTVQNTRTATLVHRLDAAATGTCSQRCQYGYTSDATGRVNGQPRTPGRAPTYASKHELFCHSPYCIYATSGTSRRLQTFKTQALAAPDVAAYSSGPKARQTEDESGSECIGVEEAVSADQSADQVGDGMVLEAAEVPGSQNDAADRWLREDDEKDEAVEARSRRSSETSSPPSPSDDVTSRPLAADVLDILGLAASTPPTATSVDGRRVVFNGLYNDHITNNNNYNSNNNSVAS